MWLRFINSVTNLPDLVQLLRLGSGNRDYTLADKLQLLFINFIF